MILDSQFRPLYPHSTMHTNVQVTGKWANWEMTANKYLVITFARGGSKDAPISYSFVLTAIHSSISQMGNWSMKRSNLHKIIGLCRKWWSSNWSPRSLAAACGLLSQQHAMNLGCPSATMVPMHTLLTELWACEENGGDRQRENTKK